MWNVTKLLKKFSLFLTQPYMGHTGYSTTENVNNIKIVHLHWGLQLIFDESQKEGNNENLDWCVPADKVSGLAYAGGGEVEGDEGVGEDGGYWGSQGGGVWGGEFWKSEYVSKREFLRKGRIIGKAAGSFGEFGITDVISAYDKNVIAFCAVIR